MASRKPSRRPRVHAELQSLGLRSNTTSARAVYTHDAVNRLYREELPSLFRILVRDQGSSLNRDDPALFDKELDQLLREYGPLIWPGEGNRDHLLTAQAGTPYESDLVYPRDTAVLKSRLLRNILVKKAIDGVDYQAQMEKKAGGSDSPVSKTDTQSYQTTHMQGFPDIDKSDSSIDSSEESVVGARARPHDILQVDFSHVQLRLYRKTDFSVPGASSPVLAYGSMFLGLDCATSQDCFNQVCERISAECSFMVFRLPEDMSQAGSIRLNRGSDDSEATFQRVLAIFRNAKKFPGAPQYRSLEVEVGLDVDDALLSAAITPIHDGSSSPLSSALSSPLDPSMGSVSLGAHVSQRSVMREESVAPRTVPQPPNFECFSHFSNGSGHYYSAPKLFARGVWIGYLSPENQKKPYRGLPSFKELQANFRDMNLPFPSPNPGSSGSNREAVCRGCFGAKSGLFTLREMTFVKDRSLVIMPLDGNDEMGMFCILIPQPMDRSTKNLQAWRPYEVGNGGGDGSTFSNKFALLTLRYTGVDIGTVEAVGAKRQAPAKSNMISRLATNRSTFQAPMNTLSVQLYNKEDDTDGPLLSDKARAARKRKSKVNRERKSAKSKRKRTETGVLRLPISQDNLRALGTRVDLAKEPQVLDIPNHTKDQPPLTATNKTAQMITTVVESQASSNQEIPPVVPAIGLTDQQARNINIVWTVDVDGQECDFSLTMAECSSFSEMLKVLSGMAQYFPAVTTILDKANMWLLTYMDPKGVKKTQIGRKGTEVAFNRMRNDLCKTCLAVGEVLDVELRAV